MPGTNNKQISVFLKDYIKGLLFLFSNKASKVSQLKNANTLDEKFTVCNSLLGVHQSKYEIIEFVKYVQSHQTHQIETICEIGTANSGTSLFLATALPEIKHLICIDLFVKNKVQLKALLPHCRVDVINGSSYDSNTLDKVHKLIGDKKIDLLFIDGDHSYDGVEKDFTLYSPFVARGGVIAFHDIVEDYATKYNQATGMWAGEVPRFWKQLTNTISPENKYEIIEFPDQDGKGIGILTMFN